MFRRDWKHKEAKALKAMFGKQSKFLLVIKQKGGEDQGKNIMNITFVLVEDDDYRNNPMDFD